MLNVKFRWDGVKLIIIMIGVTVTQWITDFGSCSLLDRTSWMH